MLVLPLLLPPQVTFQMQRVPGGHYLALKPQHTSVQRINKTPELRDRAIAKWYLSSKDFFFFGLVSLSLSISPPFGIVNTVIMELSESSEGKGMCLDKVAGRLPIALIPLYRETNTSEANGWALTKNNCIFWPTQNPVLNSGR